LSLSRRRSHRATRHQRDWLRGRSLTHVTSEQRDAYMMQTAPVQEATGPEADTSSSTWNTSTTPPSCTGMPLKFEQIPPQGARPVGPGRGSMHTQGTSGERRAGNGAGRDLFEDSPVWTHALDRRAVTCRVEEIASIAFWRWRDSEVSASSKRQLASEHPSGAW
jgi:hypothetical protein